MAKIISKDKFSDTGMGNFTTLQDNPFDEVSSGLIAFSDIDGDNDQDVLITGISAIERVSKLYANA